MRNSDVGNGIASLHGRCRTGCTFGPSTDQSMKHSIPCLLASLAFIANCRAQTLIDSIPYPGISQGFWGITVNPDTIFLGADFSGDIYYSDHDGNILGQQPTGFNFNHGLVRKPISYLLAEDYSSNGAHLYEVDVQGTLLNTWAFPDVIGGHSSGIGDICADGDAIWYTMYYPDFDTYPFAYAYKWIPGDASPIDTVPMHGSQPYGIALKGDTLLYVTDDLDDDAERIYSYNLATGEDIGYVELPDPDGDQSPRGLYYDGTLLYLVANRIGGSAFAYQTVYLFSFDPTVGITTATAPRISIQPSLADDRAVMELPFMGHAPSVHVGVFDATGTQLLNQHFTGTRVAWNTASWNPGLYLVRATLGDRQVVTGRMMVAH